MSNKVLAAVADLLPAIAERADACEKARQVPVESMTDLTQAGVFRMLQPKRWDGLEADPVEFYEVIRAIAAADGATG
ncbi:MAG: acyl-CoA dehydrogenase family protein, partial [Mycobacteriales bacterium]